MPEVEFLSDEWLDALDTAARDRAAPPDDPLADVDLVVEQVIEDGPRWRLVVRRGALSVRPSGADDPPADIRLTSGRSAAADIAAGRRAALDAFIAGDLVIGGDVQAMLANREALEALGDLFADVRTRTSFDPPAAERT
jgi:hypothetical protein